MIWSLAASPDNKRLAVGCEDGSVIILDVSGGLGSIEQQLILQRQNSRVLSLAWNGNDKLIGGLADARISIWSTKRETSGRILATVKVDKSKQRESTLVWSIKVLNDRIAVSGDSTGSVKFWDTQKFSLLQSFSAHEADVLCLTCDVSGRTVYSAGVDRKIMCYQIVNRNSGRWAAMGSSMVHGHDVRAMALHESSSSNFLVSGGVERTLVINDLNDFMFGSYRKLPITPQSSCVSSVPGGRLVILWDSQVVKIWYVGELQHLGDEDSQLVAVPVQGKKLVCRITMSSDENITSAALSSDGKLLVVSTIVETKIFRLTPISASGNRKKSASTNIIPGTNGTPAPAAYKVTKLNSHDLEDQGARSLRLIERNGEIKLLLVSPESELLIYGLKNNSETNEYGVDLESDPIELSTPKSQLINSDGFGKNTISNINYLDSVSHAEVSPNGRFVAVSHFSGVVYLFDITAAFDNPESLTQSTSENDEDDETPIIEGIVLGKFPGLPTAMAFTTRDTLVIVTAEVRVFEYSITATAGAAENQSSLSSLLQAQLTPWSKTNSELLPQELTEARDKCRGIFYDPEKPQRLWLWAGTWLAFLDTSVDIPVKRIPKRLANGKVAQYGSRRLEALGIVADDDTVMEDAEPLETQEPEEPQPSTTSVSTPSKKSRRKSKTNGTVVSNDTVTNNSNSSNGSNNIIINNTSSNGSGIPEVDDSVSVLGRRAFWITYKYRPILFASTFGSKEMVVIERPVMDLKLPPAFWSNRKITF